MGLKVCTFADFHLGNQPHGIIDSKTGLNTRVLNALQSLDKTLEYCINNNIQYIIIAGDVYKNNLPSPTLQEQFNKRMQYASDNGITVLLMDGNHDVSPLKTSRSALETFNTLRVNNINYSRYKHSYYINDNLKVLMLPTYCKEEEIIEILDEEKENIPTIVVGHLTLLGAKLNDWLIEQNESGINMEIFKRPNIIAVVLGHLHKYQILNEDPLIYYTGSLQRIDFNEEHQEKGFVVLDINGSNVNYKFVEIESQKFFTLDLDLRDKNNDMDILLSELDNNSDKIKDSIVRLRLSLNKNNLINDELITKKLEDLKMHSLASIQKNIDKDEITRNNEINENINEEKALEIYFKNNDNKDELVKLGLDMINTLKNENKI